MAATWQAIIIGGGPGGTSAATFLARAGHRVLVLEKEHFPRFHIGESLLPYNRLIFEEMGVWPTLQAEGFLVKHGAQFHLGLGTKSTRFDFRQGRFTRVTQAIQVERARFDHVLLRHARTAGAEVREGWTVRRVATDADGVRVEASNERGAVETLRAAFVIDASGRGNLTGNQEGLRVVHPRLRKLALFGHFTGVRRDPGESANDTVIVRLPEQWFWLIPLSSEKVSVGCVLDQREFAAHAGTPAEIFARLVQSNPTTRARMAGAGAVGPIQTTSDFSYSNRRFVGQRLLRVGDAAGFMDPIFSAGVYLAMHSGKLAAETVQAALACGDDGAQGLARYEQRVRRSMRVYWRMVEQFYTKPFMELFLQPRHRLHIPSAVNALLAGELDYPWPVRWRMSVFYTLVKAQRRWPLVPRLRWDVTDEGE